MSSQLKMRIFLLVLGSMLLAHALPDSADTTDPASALSTPLATPAPTKKSTASKGIGFLCAGIAVFFFGTNFVPVKKFESGDGFFFQFVMCCGVFTVGHVVNAIQGYPKFEPIAMMGGFLWAFGNLMSVPIIKCIGMSLGLLIWGATNMMIGWGTGTFGWFDLDGAKRDIAKPWLNYLGFGLAVCALVCYLFIQPAEEVTQDKSKEQDLEGFSTADTTAYEKLVNDAFQETKTTKREARHSESFASSASRHSDKSLTSFFGAEVIEATMVERSPESAIDKLPPSVKRTVGVGMAVVTGCLFGGNFSPPKWVELHRVDTAPQSDIDYVFAHFCGIWLTSLTALIIYVIYSKNEPMIFPRLMAPAFLSGVMWGIAQTCWFIANDALGFSVAFPIICTGPGLLSAFWGVLLFDEISGKRNFIILGVACFFTLASSICIAISS